MEKTLVILKPCTVQRGLIGEIVTRFEKKGLRLAGMKMVWLTDEILSEHYAHLKEKPFFQRIKDAMSVCPVIVYVRFPARIPRHSRNPNVPARDSESRRVCRSRYLPGIHP